MKTIKLIAVLLLAILTCGQLQAYDRMVFLEATRLKENSETRGAAGELGPYQMMPKTVKDSGGHDKVAALYHLKYLERNLKRKGVAVNPFNLALCWNAGFDRATHGKAKVFSYRYAGDVVEIYNRLTRKP